MILKKILLIHTGGTISMLENKETGEVYTTNKHPLSEATYILQEFADVEEKIIFSLPSPHITPDHMLELGKLINSEMNNYDGFVVTHGTDTLEETAYFLDLMLVTKKPVIITGAMRSSNEIGSDALYNLISSIRVASDERAIEQGVLVVMNDEIHTAANVTKTSTSNVATFKSPQYGPIGIITKDSLLFHHQILKRKKYVVSSITKKVLLLRAFAGMDGEIFEAINERSIDGLVVEGFGQGNLPKDVIPPLKRMIANNIPIVLVSRCFQGIVQPTYSYDGGGKHLKDMGIIFTNGLTGPKARIKLLLALEQTNDLQKLHMMFQID
ncbi:asparaginase [Virgibacillus sp. LDC-1]|uniref:asparaginase n=1 Tax=Virgibacillus sp. LDC-1 TaxID=3039856 RepID=UPI0032E7FC07